MVDVNRELLALAFTVSFALQLPRFGYVYIEVAELIICGLQHPFLMHASLAVALAYDHYLSSSSGARRTLEECYHWSRSTSLFNKRLQKQITAEDKDAIWGTAAALTVLAFASPDASTPEESWPLRPSDPLDLEWLRMRNGKMSLWVAANPMRPDSIFRVLAGTYAIMDKPLPEVGIEGMPDVLVSICQLDLESTAKGSVYFQAAHTVSQIHNLPDDQVTVGHIDRFISSIHGAFEILVRYKDPVALLLLYLWYSKARRNIWWIELRARVECPSIFLYLQRFHKDLHAVHAILLEGLVSTNN